MTTWIRCYWDEDDVWFYFEIGSDGQVTRQIELQGPNWSPIAAASLEEWSDAQASGRFAAYEAEFGGTAQLPISEWEGHSPEVLTLAAFEDVWASARQDITSRRE